MSRREVDDREITLVVAKPDAVKRSLIGRILTRFEEKGLTVLGTTTHTFNPKTRSSDERFIQTHYKDLASKPYFPDILRSMTGTCVAFALYGPYAVSLARSIIGETDPLEASPGTIRGDWAINVGRNLVHGSATPEEAMRELSLWFGRSFDSFDDLYYSWMSKDESKTREERTNLFIRR